MSLLLHVPLLLLNLVHSSPRGEKTQEYSCENQNSSESIANLRIIIDRASYRKWFDTDRPIEDNGTENEIVSSVLDGMIAEIELAHEEEDEELDWEKGSQMSASVVSESYLEDLGLRSSRASTPSLHSPAHNLNRMLSTPSLHFLHQYSQSEDLAEVFNNEDKEEKLIQDENIDENDQTLEEDDYFFDFIDLDPNDSSQVMMVPLNDVPTEIEGVEETVMPPGPLTRIPGSVLASIMEYCSDQEVLEARLVNSVFKEASDSYLRLLSNLTIPGTLPPFRDQYRLLTTMMPLYRRQPQIKQVLSGLLCKTESWCWMSLVNLADLRGFKSLAIFSDSFIEMVLIPELEKAAGKDLNSNSQDPPALFLLGEALLKNGRSELFERALLPVLNSISVTLFYSGFMPQQMSMSAGFLEFPSHSPQRILGVTLHTAIHFALSLTVVHLVKLEPQSIHLKNQFGRTALMKIAECLCAFRTAYPGPKADEEISEWFNVIIDRFIAGESIQPVFSGNSRLLIEIFLMIVKQISETFESRAMVVDFLGLNEEYTFIRVFGNSLYQKTGTLVHELIAAQQYDLIFSLGFHFGDLIACQQDINPLHLAAKMNDPLLTMILLRFFVNLPVNQLNAAGSTALGMAVGANAYESTRILLADPRTDPNLNKCVSPLIRSIEVCPIELVELLLTHPSIDIHLQVTQYSKPLSPFICAAQRRNWKVLELLLRREMPDTSSNMAMLKVLRDAEKALVRAGEKYQDVLGLVRRAILPTIQEEHT